MDHGLNGIDFTMFRQGSAPGKGCAIVTVFDDCNKVRKIPSYTALSCHLFGRVGLFFLFQIPLARRGTTSCKSDMHQSPRQELDKYA